MIKKGETQTLLLSIACACFLLVAQGLGISILIFAALACFLAMMVFAKDECIIPLFLFFIPFSTVLKVSVDSISFSSVGIVLVFALKCLTNLKTKVPTILIISIIGIVITSLLASIINNYGISPSYIMFVGMLVAFPLITIWTNNKVNYETCVLFYSLGIILATILSFIYRDNYNLLAYINVFMDETIVERHCGFYADPNFYAAQIITAIGGQFLLINKKKNMKFWNVILLFALIVCGAYSVSKSFIICFFAVFLAWMFCQVKNGVGNFVKVLFVISVVVAVVLGSGAFSNIVDQYLFRFGMAEDASSLTTGRSGLWREYLDFLINNPVDLLLGQGYTSVFKGVHKGSHNSLIQCIYQLGIVGGVFFAYWFITVVGLLKTRKVKFSYMILLVVSCFSMWLGLDVMFFDDLFLTILLFAFGLKYAQNELKITDEVSE